MRLNGFATKPGFGRTIIVIPIVLAALAAGCQNISFGSPKSASAAMPRPRIPDFRAIRDTDEKKREFFSYLRPIVEEENNRLLSERREVERIRDLVLCGNEMTGEERSYILNLHEDYCIELPEDGISYDWDLLLRRIDVVPTELALIQAAKESGWGTSRFVSEGYNFFGQLCFSEGCGIVPSRREPGDRHEVARFESPSQAVKSYMLNLNSHYAYTNFRSMRLRDRTLGREPEGYHLALALPDYSVQRDDYIESVRGMMLQNREHLEN